MRDIQKLVKDLRTHYYDVFGVDSGTANQAADALERVETLVNKWDADAMYPKSQRDVAAPLFAEELRRVLGGKE